VATTPTIILPGKVGRKGGCIVPRERRRIQCPLRTIKGNLQPAKSRHWGGVRRRTRMIRRGFYLGSGETRAGKHGKREVCQMHTLIKVELFEISAKDDGRDPYKGKKTKGKEGRSRSNV